MQGGHVPCGLDLEDEGQEMEVQEVEVVEEVGELDEEKVNQVLYAMPLHELVKNKALIEKLAASEELSRDQREIFEALKDVLSGRIDYLVRRKIALEAEIEAMEAVVERAKQMAGRFDEYLEFATVQAGGSIKGQFFTAEMRKPGGQDPIEVRDIGAVPELFKRHTITIRRTIPASDKEMLRYWQTIALGHEPPTDERLLSSVEIAILDAAIKTEVEKAEIKKLLKTGAEIPGVTVAERQKKLHIKELKVIEKKKRATKALAALAANEEESDAE